MARAPGFSLVELLAALAVLGALAFAAVQVAAPSAEQRLGAAAQEIVHALRFAQAEALRTGRFHGADFSVDVSTGKRRVRVFRTDSATPPNPVYDVRHPLDKKLYEVRLDDIGATSGVDISAAAFFYQSGATILARDWAAFDAAGMPEYYPDPVPYAAISSPPNLSAVTLSFRGRTVQVLLGPLTGRVTWS